MQKVLATCLALCAACVAIPATSANADPVTVTGGRVTAHLNSGTFTLTGDGMWLTGDTGGFDGEIFQCEPCSPADHLPYNLSSSTGGQFSSGPRTIFNGVEFAQTNLFGHLAFSSPVTFTSATGLRSVISPFTFRGEILNFPPGGDGFPLFFADLSGSGIATTHFTGPVGEGFYFADSITYDFASPTPEPASLLLLGAGAATVLVRARRKRSVSGRRQ